MAGSAKKEENKPEAPDPARVYERAKPEFESGMGRLDNNKATPAKRPDQLEKTVHNRQGPRQINAEDQPLDNGRIKNKAKDE